MEQISLLSLIVAVTLTLVERSEGHGFMIEPPGRSSMWRAGFTTPINYNDNAVRCAISEKNCRVCGDKDNEAGGKYATGTIAREYIEGQNINLTIVISANHLGYFEFSLCPNNNASHPVTEECLGEHILELEGGVSSFPLQTGVRGPITMKAKLPEGFTCSQCVLRWFWKTGNSWGVDPKTGDGCLGCGDQERFFACADVSISRDGVEKTKGPSRPTPVTSEEDLP